MYGKTPSIRRGRNRVCAYRIPSFVSLNADTHIVPHAKIGDIRLAERGNLGLPLRHIPPSLRIPSKASKAHRHRLSDIEKIPTNRPMASRRDNHLFMSGKRIRTRDPQLKLMLYRLSYFRVRSANIRNLPNFHHHSANFYFLRPTSTINGPGHRCYTENRAARIRLTGKSGHPQPAADRPSDTLSGYRKQPDTVRETECKTGVSPYPVHCSAVGRSLRKTHGDTTVLRPAALRSHRQAPSRTLFRSPRY